MSNRTFSHEVKAATGNIYSSVLSHFMTFFDVISKYKNKKKSQQVTLNQLENIFIFVFLYDQY